MIRSSTLAWSLLFFLTTGVAAEEPHVGWTAKSLGAALASDQAADQAWAAYRIGQLGSEELIPELVVALLTDPEGSDQQVVSDRNRSIGDALIRLRAQLTLGDLTSVATTCDQDVLLTLCGLQDQLDVSPLVLPLIGDIDPQPGRAAQWMAACNLALRRPNHETVAALADGLSVEIVVTVSDDGQSRGGHQRSVLSGDGLITRRPGFPPVVRYRLTLSPQVGDAVATVGPSLVHVRRNEFARSTGWGFSAHSIDEDAYRLECLQSLAEDLPRQPEPMTARRLRSQRWTDAAALEAAVREQIATEQERWQELRASLIAADLWPADRPLPIEWRLSVQDRRDRKNSPLPALQHLLPNTDENEDGNADSGAGDF